MADNPEIRVRLSPEGQADVIAALRQVQREAGKASHASAGGVGLLNDALRELKALVPAIGLAAAVAGIFALGRHALQSADEIGKMGQRVGASAENVSALVFAAATADVTNEQLTKGLGFLSKSLGDLNRGIGEQIDLFDELGLTAKDFTGKDTVQAFALISERLGAMEDGSKKTELALRILGRGGAQLIPLMNDLAEKGFANVYAEARKLGLIMSGDLVESATAARDSMKLVGKQVEGLAVQFVSGLAPSIVEAMTRLREETGGGLEAFKTLGEFVGKVANGIVVSWLLAGAAIGFVIALVEEKSRDLQKLGADIAKGAVAGGVKTGPVGSIIGGVKALFTPSPDSKEQLALLDQFKEKIDEITRAIDAKELAKRAKTLQDTFDDIAKDINLSEFEKTQKRLTEITKRAGLEQITAVEEIAKQRREAAEKGAQAEEAALKARLASTPSLLSTQRQLEEAEIASIARRVAAAQEAFQSEVKLSKEREEALVRAAAHQFGAKQESVRLIAEIEKRSSKEQLASAKTLFDALIAEQINFFNKSKAAKQQLVDLDKEIADSRKQAGEFVRGIEREGFTEEQKAELARRDLWENEAKLRDAVLRGDVDKQKEFRAEALKFAQVLKQLGDPVTAQRGVEEAQRLFELGAESRTQAARAAAKSAEDGAAAIQKMLDETRSQVAKLQDSLLLELKFAPSQESLKSMVQTIRDELGRTPFQIGVQPIIRQGTSFSDVPGTFSGATGGRVPGVSPTRYADNIHIMATAGEFMQPVRAVEYYGLDFMEAIRRMQLPKFAEGGMVGGDAGGGAEPSELVRIELAIGGRTHRLLGERARVGQLVEDLHRLKSL